MILLHNREPWNQRMTGAIVRSAPAHDLPEVLSLYRHLHPDDPDLETAAADTPGSEGTMILPIQIQDLHRRLHVVKAGISYQFP